LERAFLWSCFELDLLDPYLIPRKRRKKGLKSETSLSVDVALTLRPLNWSQGYFFDFAGLSCR